MKCKTLAGYFCCYIVTIPIVALSVVQLISSLSRSGSTLSSSEKQRRCHEMQNLCAYNSKYMCKTRPDYTMPYLPNSLFWDQLVLLLLSTKAVTVFFAFNDMQLLKLIWQNVYIKGSHIHKQFLHKYQQLLTWSIKRHKVVSNCANIAST